jgi:hypothetical protein
MDLQRTAYFIQQHYKTGDNFKIEIIYNGLIISYKSIHSIANSDPEHVINLLCDLVANFLTKILQNSYIQYRTDLPYISYILTNSYPEYRVMKDYTYEIILEDSLIIENIKNKKIKFDYDDISNFKKEFAYNALVKHFIPDLVNIIYEYI